jgi:outer membrane protein assembly factor BamD (BamD/ComL family)
LPVLFAVFAAVYFLAFARNVYAKGEVTIQIEDNSAPRPTQEQEAVQQPALPAKSAKELKKEIKILYNEAEKNRKKRRYLYAVKYYKEILLKDPLHKKAKGRLSDIYSETKMKLDERVFYKSEDAYYAQSILYYTNNDLTAAIQEWGKYLAIYPPNDEVRDFYDSVKQQLAEEYNRKKQEELESKIKNYMASGVDLFNATKYKEAAEKFRAVLNLNPGHVQAGFYIDQIEAIFDGERRKNRKVETRTIIRVETEKVDPEKANSFYNQGLQEYAAGHVREAIELWKKCLKYNANHAKAKANIEKAEKVLIGKPDSNE